MILSSSPPSSPPAPSSSFSGSPPPSPRAATPPPLAANDDLLAALVAGFEHDDEALARMWNDAYSLPGVAEFSAVPIAEADVADCLICRSPRTVGALIPCGHDFFHPHCLSVYWDMDPHCPICRAEIPSRRQL